MGDVIIGGKKFNAQDSGARLINKKNDDTRQVISFLDVAVAAGGANLLTLAPVNLTIPKPIYIDSVYCFATFQPIAAGPNRIPDYTVFNFEIGAYQGYTLTGGVAPSKLSSNYLVTGSSANAIADLLFDNSLFVPGNSIVTFGATSHMAVVLNDSIRYQFQIVFHFA